MNLYLQILKNMGIYPNFNNNNTNKHILNNLNKENKNIKYKKNIVLH